LVEALPALPFLLVGLALLVNPYILKHKEITQKNLPYHYNPIMISIVLQAGGKSTRMGKDKATLPFLDIPLINRLRDRFQDLGSELVVISNQLKGYEKLGVPIFQDLIPDRGALGGLYTALSIASQPLVGLIAADMPFADPDLLSYQKDLMVDGDWDAVIPSTAQGIEPFHAVYRVKTCMPLVKRAIEKDLWKMVAWHDQAKIKILEQGITRKITGSDHTFLNLNTPDEFREAEKIAARLKDFH
jgi:molybdopterin-guanine dinucleotide biosynthesis protein A